MGQRSPTHFTQADARPSYDEWDIKCLAETRRRPQRFPAADG